MNDKVTATSSSDKTVIIGNETTTASKDTTLTLTLQEEKAIKRWRQLDNVAITLIILNGKPAILVVNGKPEVLGKVG